MASFGTLYIEGPANLSFKRTHVVGLGPNRIGRVSRADELDETAQAAEIVLPDDNVSADHALITAVVTGCYITDIGSKKGTVVIGSNDAAAAADGKNGAKARGTRVPQQTSRLLRDGDQIVIGPFVLRYEHRVSLPSNATQRSAAVLRPEAAARQWQAERQRQVRPATDPALFQRERVQLRHAPSEYLQYLPWIYHESNLINELLLSFQETWRPIEETLDAIHWYSHPMVAPEALLGWLAGWFDLALDASWPVARRRAAIGRAVELYQWRGTARGLQQSIELLTGLRVELIEAGQEARITPPLTPALEPHEFYVLVRSPRHELANNRPIRQVIQRIIEHARPAQTSYRLDIVFTRRPRRPKLIAPSKAGNLRLRARQNIATA